VQIRRVRLDPPIRFYRDGRLTSANDAIELLVQTTATLPIRDLTPAIFVGDVPVTHYDRVGANQYRFRAFDVDRLQRGARISIGWPFAPASRIPTPFVFDPGGFPVA
jgi:hypothetical protein